MTLTQEHPMELETVSPPPAYSVQTGQPGKEPMMDATPPVQATMETQTNAGRVRVPGTLGRESAWVDCPNCQRREKTIVEDTKSQATSICQVVCCVSFFPFFCTLWIPTWRKWFFDTHHKCSNCNEEIAFVSHNQDRIVPEFVSSKYGS